MGILSKKVILRDLREGGKGDGLIITPLSLTQIGDASVDMHLGNEFIVFKRASVTNIDIKSKDYDFDNVHKYQEKVRIGREDRFVLHPHQLVLGATREYISLPDNLAASIVGRSTWGRTGLIIATATQISPGFKGCITLELVNEGEVPLVLYSGLLIAQLVLYRMEGKCESIKGRYQYQTGPEFPNLRKEREYF
ncbi:dCTP deaminase [Candidatus Pacearchaeota archaeon]|nr:dCTP deaminase [Candidatus Pacearchaeota archaeon]